MKTIKENRLTKICEPEFGTILYRDRDNSELYYLSVLCGGIGQYERTLMITKGQYEELHLDDEFYLKRFAYEIAKGKTGYEEIQITNA